MLTEVFAKSLLYEVAVAVAIAFFYIKITAKDDTNLSKDLFRVAVLVFLTKSIVFYVTYDGRNEVAMEPFFS
jgi:hypothetical protein